MFGKTILAFLVLIVNFHFFAISEEIHDNEIEGGKKLVCYWGTWAYYRPDQGKFEDSHIDPHLCTHLMYGFVGLSQEGTIRFLDPYLDLPEDWGRGMVQKFTNLKKQNPKLKTLLAIGGWNEGSEKYSKMASTHESRHRFIMDSIRVLQKYNFDGLDLDWEYPAHRGGNKETDKRNHATLVRELKTEYSKHGLLLTAAVSAGEATIKNAYDVSTISQYLDIINLMAYDFHGAWETFTGHHSPLGLNRLDTYGENKTYSAEYAVKYWLSQGATKDKIVLGMGSYGRGFVLNNPKVHGVYAPADQPLPQGPYTREKGFWGYNEICDKFRREGNQWKIVRDPDYKAPYAYKESERLWIGYDDVESIELKAQFARDMGLAGGMIWSLETDDFRGVCGGGKYPLIKAVKRVLNGGEPVTSQHVEVPTSEPESMTPITPEHEHSGENMIETTPSRPQPPPTDVCKMPGFNENKNGDCKTFYYCTQMDGTWKVDTFHCAEGTGFDPTIQGCQYEDQVANCKKN